MPEIECNKCEWQGDTSSLHCSDDDHKAWQLNHRTDKPMHIGEIKFNLCPECGSSDIVDYEESEE